MRRLLLALLLAACGETTLQPFDAGAAEAALPAVAAALREGDGSTALAELERAAAAGPLPDGALLLRALALDMNGRAEEAQQALQQELEAHPGDGRARALLARHRLEAGELDEAAAELKLARQLAPDDLVVRLIGGRLALARHDDEAALRAFQDVLAEDAWGSAAVEAHSGLAQILARRGPAEAAVARAHEQAAAHLAQLRAALAEARARQRSDPRDVEASWALAATWLGLFRELNDGRLRDEAEAELQRMLKLAPHDARALYSLGFLRGTQRRFDEALDLSRRAVAAAPDDVQARVNLSLLLAQTGHAAEAVPHMEVVAQQAPELIDRVRAHADIAHLLSDSTDSTQKALAASHARAALDLMPSDPFGVRKLLDKLEGSGQAPPAPSKPAGP
jgi:tetratricopeptide (TPR) repeat protein